MAQPSWVWREIAEVIGVLSVVASLVFVALEIRQNTDAVRSSTVQDISRWSYDATMALVESPEIVAARVAACSGTMSQDQKTTLHIYYEALLRLQLNRYQQAQLGIVDEELALNLGGRGGAYANPYFAEVWANVNSQFSPGFANFIERQVLTQPGNACQIGF